MVSGFLFDKNSSKLFDDENREHSQTKKKIMNREKNNKNLYKLIKVFCPNYHRQNAESIFQRISVEFSEEKKKTTPTKKSCIVNIYDTSEFFSSI